MRIRFTEDYTVKDGEAKTYKAGKTYDLPETSCQHFVNRHAAVYTDAEPQTAMVDPGEKAVKPRGRPRNAVDPGT
jgi:hypothetical protein